LSSAQLLSNKYLAFVTYAILSICLGNSAMELCQLESMLRSIIKFIAPAAAAFGLAVSPAVASDVSSAAVIEDQPADMVLFASAPQDLPQWTAGKAEAHTDAYTGAQTHEHPSYAQGLLRPAAQPAAIMTGRVNYNRGIADYGPFRMIDGRRAALLGETDRSSPYWFARMLRDYPELSQIDMVECPGTRDDFANLKLGRMIREAGLATYVPSIGSVRSGAVELFLAGQSRKIDKGAEFAVHSWRDAQGREADDFAMSAPENRKYFDYYADMGMSVSQARGFYAMTNSVPHHQALWLDAKDMRVWNEFGSSANEGPSAHKAVQVASVDAPRLSYF
jgi:hypothetical protein